MTLIGSWLPSGTPPEEVSAYLAACASPYQGPFRSSGDYIYSLTFAASVEYVLEGGDGHLRVADVALVAVKKLLGKIEPLAALCPRR